MKRLLLAGAGHCHALLLKAFAQRGVKNFEITLVSPNRFSPYSGMIPGWIGGHYRWEECCIDFEKLCNKVGAQLLLDAIAELQPNQGTLKLQSGKTLDFDILSLDVGSTLAPLPGTGSTVLPMRPISDLPSHWNKLQENLLDLPAATPFRIVTIGGGAAGVEVALAAAHSLKILAPQVVFSFALATQDDDILLNMAATARTRLHRHLNLHRIELITNFRAHAIASDSVVSLEGKAIQADAILLASGAQPHAWLRASGLALDAQGFVRVDATLRSRSHTHIFASGDCAGWETPLPKAGVYAVRMAPVLTQNIIATAKSHPFQTYVPQNQYLALIGTDSRHAVAVRGRCSWEGRSMGWLKQMIDTRFVARMNQ
ncbi:MAG: hypothetical protein C4516_10035 [Oxalobacter sp.]|nr:MAG: hypothetical protein C4516_10035 [Oxalobacter sp.]